jgi:hypothetical protein
LALEILDEVHENRPVVPHSRSVTRDITRIVPIGRREGKLVLCAR